VDITIALHGALTIPKNLHTLKTCV
jgi:hypothetical protein